MSPVDSRVALLVSESRRDWAAVLAHHQKATSVDPAAGDAQAALVALSLDHAYQAFESILVRVERHLGLPERLGSSWHARLLSDAALGLPGIRPAIAPLNRSVTGTRSCDSVISCVTRTWSISTRSN